jgi:hypothetical protein
MDLQDSVEYCTAKKKHPEKNSGWVSNCQFRDEPATEVSSAPPAFFSPQAFAA